MSSVKICSKHMWSTDCYAVHQCSVWLLRKFPHNRGQKFVCTNCLHVHCTLLECRSLRKWYVLVISSVWMAKNCSLHSLVIKKASFCLSQCSAYAQGCCISWLIRLQTALLCQSQVRRNTRWMSALQQWTTLLVSVTHSRKFYVPPFSPHNQVLEKKLGEMCV
jgi:hypothetical protein